MAKIIHDGRMLDPVQYGVIPMVRRTKGIEHVDSGTGFNLKFNLMPPGLDIVDAENEPDDQRISKLTPIGPIFS